MKITGETTLGRLEAELRRLKIDRVTSYTFQGDGPRIPPRVFVTGLFTDQVAGGNIGPSGTGTSIIEALDEFIANAERHRR